MNLATHFDLLVRSWKAETRRRRENRRRFVETEFLPAALEISETPPSPLGRAVLWVILAAAVTTLAWAVFSRVDTVAVAEGRIVPRSRLQTIASPDAGIVRAIYVTEGQRVKAGQVLVELDPTVASADAETARKELSTAALQRARAGALLAYIGGRAPSLNVDGVADPAAIAAERQLVTARIQELEAKLAQNRQKRAGAEADAEMARQQVLKITETLPYGERQLAALKSLDEKGYAPKLKILETEQAVVGMRREVQVQQARQREAEAQVGALERERAQLIEQFTGQAAQEKAEAEAVFATRSQTVRKADQRESLQRLVAPVSGRVQEVTLSTVGGVVAPGKTLISIVPDNDELVAEVMVLNRDVGELRVGQQAAVKLEAYPFTRYGVVLGQLEYLSPDSIIDEKRGLVFPARVRLVRNELRVPRRAEALSPGMTVAAEVVTGRHRVIDYLLSPVAKATKEAGRER